MFRMSRCLTRCAVALVMLAGALAIAAAQPAAPRPTQASAPINVTVRDTIRVSIQGTREALSGTPPIVTTQTKRDLFDWLGLIAALLVAPIFALLAARVGAKIGGEAARSAAIEGQEREAADARRLRAEERRENEVSERALLLRRFERDLTTAGGIVTGLATTQQITPVMPMSAGNLRAMWDSFVRRRDAVMLLTDPDIEHEVEFFYEWAFSRSALFVTWLETETALLSFGNPDADDIHRRAAVAELDVRTHVERAQGVLPRFRARVEQLAEPPPSHN